VRTAINIASFRAKGVGIVNGSLRRVVGEPRLFHRADYTDNREGFGILSLLAAFKESLTERARIGPVVPREIFVHNADSFGTAGSRRMSETALPARRSPIAAKYVAVNAIRIVAVR